MPSQNMSLQANNSLNDADADVLYMIIYILQMAD